MLYEDYYDVYDVDGYFDMTLWNERINYIGNIINNVDNIIHDSEHHKDIHDSFNDLYGYALYLNTNTLFLTKHHNTNADTCGYMKWPKNGLDIPDNTMSAIMDEIYGRVISTILVDECDDNMYPDIVMDIIKKMTHSYKWSCKKNGLLDFGKGECK